MKNYSIFRGEGMAVLAAFALVLFVQMSCIIYKVVIDKKHMITHIVCTIC